MSCLPASVSQLRFSLLANRVIHHGTQYQVSSFGFRTPTNTSPTGALFTPASLYHNTIPPHLSIFHLLTNLEIYNLQHFISCIAHGKSITETKIGVGGFLKSYHIVPSVFEFHLAGISKRGRAASSTISQINSYQGHTMTRSKKQKA